MVDGEINCMGLSLVIRNFDVFFKIFLQYDDERFWCNF